MLAADNGFPGKGNRIILILKLLKRFPCSELLNQSHEIDMGIKVLYQSRINIALLY